MNMETDHGTERVKSLLGLQSITSRGNQLHRFTRWIKIYRFDSLELKDLPVILLPFPRV
ncbi:hypothetical protein E2C01_084651 [Portunus trituberculatus]|uniref:Uncharacterized protein n=1 Tax=Portunus trituberculatus TaxID=210409 RepID=A0A5B7JBA0_PORTR|nr:hypothetical protein [Portunus trituberculatus]